MKYSLSFDVDAGVELMEALAGMIAAKVIDGISLKEQMKDRTSWSRSIKSGQSKDVVVKTRPLTSEEPVLKSVEVQPYDSLKDRIPVRDRELEKGDPEEKSEQGNDLPLGGQEKSTGYLSDRKLRKKAPKIQESKEGRE